MTNSKSATEVTQILKTRKDLYINVIIERISDRNANKQNKNRNISGKHNES